MKGLLANSFLGRVLLHFKRRTRVAGLFPNEASTLHLVSAILMDISQSGSPAKPIFPQISNN